MAISKALLTTYDAFSVDNNYEFQGTKSQVISALSSTSSGSAAQTNFSTAGVMGSLVSMLSPVFSSSLDEPIPDANRIRGFVIQARIAGELVDSANPNATRTLGFSFNEAGNLKTYVNSIASVPLNSFTFHVADNNMVATPGDELLSWNGISVTEIFWRLHGSSITPRATRSYELALRVLHYSPPIISNLTGERDTTIGPPSLFQHSLQSVRLTWDWNPNESEHTLPINRSGFREVFVFALEDAPDPDNMPSLSLLVAQGQNNTLGPSNGTDFISIDGSDIRNFRDYRVYARSARGAWPYDPPFYSNWTSAVVSFEPNGVVRPVVISVDPISNRKYNRTKVELDTDHTGSDYDPEFYYVLRDGKRVTGNIPIMEQFFHDVGVTPGIEHSYTAIAGAKSELDFDAYVDSAESDAATAAPVVYDRWLLRNAEHQQLTSSNNDPLDSYDEFNIELEVDGDSSLDMESGDDRADFNPLGRRGYISISDTLRAYKFSVDIQVMGYEAYKRFQHMRESRALMLLQAPMTGRKWFFRLGKVREKIQNTSSDYYKITFDVAENDEPQVLGLTDTFMDNPHGP